MDAETRALIAMNAENLGEMIAARNDARRAARTWKQAAKYYRMVARHNAQAIASLEAYARLGRLVHHMPERTLLLRGTNSTDVTPRLFVYTGVRIDNQGQDYDMLFYQHEHYGDTPEAALLAALGTDTDAAAPDCASTDQD